MKPKKETPNQVVSPPKTNKENPAPKVESPQIGIIGDNAFKTGLIVSLVLIVLGIAKFTGIQVGNLNGFWNGSSGSDRSPEPSENICLNSNDVSLNRHHRQIGQDKNWGCLSGIVYLPDGELSYYFPGETEIYKCMDRQCRKNFEKIHIADLNGGINPAVLRNLRAFRLKGSPGTALFRLVK